MELELGSHAFSRFEAEKTTTTGSGDYKVKSTIKTKGGSKYAGCVMEIFQNGKLLKVVENTTNSGLKAYQEKRRAPR
ncbi:MAG: hypothetical protein HC904_16455 [Blastochloris sp.]|nr:hypothetical protein [Blastochloris sp.]